MKIELPESIAAYGWRVELIVKAMQDWVSQHEFDRLTMVWHGEMAKVDGPFKGGTIILPTFRGPQQAYLGLLQEMHRLDMIEAKEEDGVIYYRSTIKI